MSADGASQLAELVAGTPSPVGAPIHDPPVGPLEGGGVPEVVPNVGAASPVEKYRIAECIPAGSCPYPDILSGGEAEVREDEETAGPVTDAPVPYANRSCTAVVNLDPLAIQAVVGPISGPFGL